MKIHATFFARIILSWIAFFVVLQVFGSALGADKLLDVFNFLMWVALILLLIAGAAHLQRVERLTGTLDAEKLKNRHTRQVEIPFETALALPMVEDSLKALPISENIKTSNNGLRLRVRVKPVDLDHNPPSLWKKTVSNLGIDRSNQAVAEISEGEGMVSVKLLCEPEGSPWLDALFPDEGTNLQNIELLTRELTQRIAAFRRGEQAVNTETATEKELAVAKLSLLHAQVEPHFLYNTLGSAKYLIASDPARAEAMLDNLILYLRHSLPRTNDAPSTLGDEVALTRAYLDILKIRMGERLNVSIELPAELSAVPFPPMMLQTLAENAINHGLEPKQGGGTVWITARVDPASNGETVTVTVADDGNGFGSGTSGTGIGLKNVRERLKLAYGGSAQFSIIANFPSGVAASIQVPVAGPKASA